MSALERFQDWHLAQCDRKWEDNREITVDTLDSPSWRVSVDPTGTYLENIGFGESVVERLEDDWARARVAESTEPTCHRRFEAFYELGSLTEALEVFLDWAESSEG